MGTPIHWYSTRIRPRLSRRSTPGSTWSNTQSGAPDAECQLPPRVNHGGTHRSTFSPAPPGVWRSGSEIPSYGSTQHERHLHATHLERRSSVTRIVAPVELPPLRPPTFLLYCLRAVGIAACSARRSVGVLT